MNERPLVIASNRGPVSFIAGPDGGVIERRGVGGLVTAVGDAVQGRPTTWIAAPMTELDRTHGGSGVDLVLNGQTPVHVRFADIAADDYERYYNEFSNRIIWFLHHNLWDATQPLQVLDLEAADWVSFRRANEAFATAMLDEADDGATVLPQDYHLSLVPRLLRDAKRDLRISLFWHIPFCTPQQMKTIGDFGPELLDGMLGADVIGFHTKWWAANFSACCASVLGATATEHAISYRGHTTRVGIYPIGVDVEGLERSANTDEVVRAFGDIDRIVGDRTVVLRADRTELSKNILRGLVAYDHLLARRRDLHGRVTHLVLLTPSRGAVPEYQEYMETCIARADAINARFGTADWAPIVLEIADDYARTLAAYKRYDVLMVNPVADGMNLVAREGPVLNERAGVLLLSANAGAAAELGNAALIVNPYDVHDTEVTLEQAIDMDRAERVKRAQSLALVAPGLSPRAWLDRQITDVER